MIQLTSLAKKLGIHSQTVSDRFKKCLKSHQVTPKESLKKGNARFFTDHAAKIIAKSNPKRSNSTPNKSVLLAKLNDMNNFIAYLKRDNKNKSNSIKSLQKLLNQQQQLQLSTSHKKDKLSSENKHLKAIRGQVQKGSYAKSKPKYRGFWARLFNRR